MERYGKTCIVFRIELMKNIFACICRNTETKSVATFEISSRKNDLHDMCDYFIQEDVIFVGYGNTKVDDNIIDYCIKYKDTNADSIRFANSIFNLYIKLIEKDNSIKKLQLNKNFESMDLIKAMSQVYNPIKTKDMAAQMSYKNKSKFGTNWIDDLDESRYDELIEFNEIGSRASMWILSKLEFDE